MPRARNLKPGFFKDAKVVSCSFEARLLFQGLWCLADYKGRLKYVPLEIKMEIFPADNVDVEEKMTELSEKGLISIYHDHSGAALVQVRKFTEHQNPHVNERQDKNKNPLPCLPSQEECEKPEINLEKESEEKGDIKQRVKDALRVLREYSESDPADSLLLIPDSLLLKPETPVQAPEEKVSPEGETGGYVFEGEKFRVNQKDFDAHKAQYPNLNLLAEYSQLDNELRDVPKKEVWMKLCAKLNYRNKNPYGNRANVAPIRQSTKTMPMAGSEQ